MTRRTLSRPPLPWTTRLATVALLLLLLPAAAPAHVGSLVLPAFELAPALLPDPVDAVEASPWGRIKVTVGGDTARR